MKKIAKLRHVNHPQPMRPHARLTSARTLSFICIFLAPWETGMAMTSTNNEPYVTQRHYGTLSDGSDITLATLSNGQGVEVDVINYGGIITRLVTPDREGDRDTIVLGLDSLEDYETNSPYYGAIIGRYGNRIAKGRFSLAGKDIQLTINDGDNHLHGGSKGFDKQVWDMETFVTEHSSGVKLFLVSPDGDQGYPGNLTTEVVYELNDNNELNLQFQATTDQTTVVNLTHHSYFNLAGRGTILNHQLMIPADHITPIDSGLIPTGELLPVEGTPFDFTDAHAIGDFIDANDEQIKYGPGYDHNWVLKQKADGKMSLSARASDPESGRVLEVWSPEPGVQFYSGNFLDGTLSGAEVTHIYRGAFCLEPQHFPDSPNHANFPSTLLEPGQTYRTQIKYRFLTQ